MFPRSESRVRLNNVARYSFHVVIIRQLVGIRQTGENGTVIIDLDYYLPRNLCFLSQIGVFAQPTQISDAWPRRKKYENELSEIAAVGDWFYIDFVAPG